MAQAQRKRESARKPRDCSPDGQSREIIRFFCQENVLEQTAKERMDRLAAHLISYNLQPEWRSPSLQSDTPLLQIYVAVGVGLSSPFTRWASRHQISFSTSLHTIFEQMKET